MQNSKISIGDVIIKKDSVEYRRWKAKQNRKNLTIRTEKRAALRSYRTRTILRNKKLKEEPEYDAKTRSYSFRVPLEFSFIKNPDETTGFFNSLLAFIADKKHFGRHLFIDISDVHLLTTDALMYLLAVINNLGKEYTNHYTISGNAPKDPVVKKLFTESGFYHFVRHQKDLSVLRNTDNLRIVSGEKTEPTVAKHVVDFTCDKLGVGRKETTFLYNMLIELMSNSHKHAYNEGIDILQPRWYCFADCTTKSQAITFTFMDIGEGIPATVRKNFIEKIDLLRIKGDNKYVISALCGEFRSETSHAYRGKGLPEIWKYCKSGQISNMRIIANHADVLVNKTSFVEGNMAKALKGTLFYWQVCTSTLRRLDK